MHLKATRIDGGSIVTVERKRGRAGESRLKQVKEEDREPCSLRVT